MVTSGGNLGQTYPTVSAERGAQCSAFHHNIISIAAAAAATIQGQCNRWMTRWREGRKHFVQSSGQRIGIFRIWIRLQTFLPVHHFLVVLFKAVGGSSSSRSSINIQVLVRYITHSLASWMDGPTRAMRRREGGWLGEGVGGDNGSGEVQFYYWNLWWWDCEWQSAVFLCCCCTMCDEGEGERDRV